MRAWLGLCLALCAAPVLAQTSERGCGAPGVRLQVLGSGGAELAPDRAGTSYLIWVDGRARLLVDIGHGAARRLAQSGAVVGDIEALLLTHMHADHTADLATLVQAAVLAQRNRVLPIYGPTGNRFAPSAVTFVRTLFDNTRGAWRHLGDVLSPMTSDGFKLEPHDVRERPRTLAGRREAPAAPIDIEVDGLKAAAVPVVHGVYPALAWRVRVADKTIVFTGDMNGESEALSRLAQSADILIASHAIEEGTGQLDRFLHMPPSVIGRLAANAGVRQLILAHRNARTLGRETESSNHIRRHYQGPIGFANDLACYTP